MREDRERLLEDLDRERERAAQEQARAEEVQREAEHFIRSGKKHRRRLAGFARSWRLRGLRGSGVGCSEDRAVAHIPPSRNGPTCLSE
jgi:hypothetical protein